jgi:hypothetical protein
MQDRFGIRALRSVAVRLHSKSSIIRTRTKDRGRATVATMLAAIIGAGLFVAGSYVPRYPVYEFHNVAVLEKVAPHKFWLSKSDGEFLFNDCDDDNWLVPGYIIAKFRYEDRGECMSMKRPDLGIWWLRDPVSKDVITVPKKEN